MAAARRQTHRLQLRVLRTPGAVILRTLDLALARAPRDLAPGGPSRISGDGANATSPFSCGGRAIGAYPTFDLTILNANLGKTGGTDGNVAILSVRQRWQSPCNH